MPEVGECLFIAGSRKEAEGIQCQELEGKSLRRLIAAVSLGSLAMKAEIDKGRLGLSGAEARQLETNRFHNAGGYRFVCSTFSQKGQTDE
jgi:hypothetical protein